MSALWTRQQREWLQAMGHRVLVLAGDETAAVTEPAAAAPVATEPATSASGERGSGRRSVPVIERAPDPRPEPLPESDPAPEPPPLAAADRVLHRALLRATGQRTTRAAGAMLRRLQTDPATLRDDVAGKRALWARLRALRKAAQRS